MTTPPAGIERRVGQRFPYLLPLSLRQPGTSVEGVGFTQDLSSRGVFFFTDAPVTEGSEIELSLKMPSEITLGDNMPVRCRGHVLRVVRPAAVRDGAASAHAETKIGVAVRFEGYEYLAESSEAAASYPRVSALHPQTDPQADSQADPRGGPRHGPDRAPRQEDDRRLAHSSARPVLS